MYVIAIYKLMSRLHLRFFEARLHHTLYRKHFIVNKYSSNLRLQNLKQTQPDHNFIISFATIHSTTQTRNHSKEFEPLDQEKLNLPRSFSNQ